MLKFPKSRLVKLANGQVKWKQIGTDYLPFAPRIAWFWKEYPDCSIITKAVQSVEKAVIMKVIIKDATGKVTQPLGKERL